MTTSTTLGDDFIRFKNSGVDYGTLTGGATDGLITFSSNAGNVRLAGISDPSSAQDAATKAYVDAQSGSTPGGSDTQIQYNNSSTFGGISQWTTNGTTTFTGSGTSILNILDNGQLNIGTGSDFSITHDATNTTITSNTGDLIVDNTLVTGSTIMRLGTDTSATDFQIQNNSTSALFIVDGVGNITMGAEGTTTTMSTETATTAATAGGSLNITTGAGNTTGAGGNLTLTAGTSPSGTDGTIIFNTNGANNMIINDTSISIPDSISVALGTGNDFTIVHNGSNSVFTNTTGNLQFFNDDATKSITFRLGSNTNATCFRVNNSIADKLLCIEGNGNTSLKGNLATNTEITTISTAGNETYTANQLFNGFIRRDPAGTSRTDTTDTAVNIIALTTPSQINDSFGFVVENTADADETITLSGGTGVTIVGTATIPQNSSRKFLVIFTNVTASSEAVSIYDMGSTQADALAGGSNTEIQYNNSGSLGGVSSWTTNGTTTFNGADNAVLNIGTGNDLSFTHDATNSIITSTTGDLIIDNTLVTGSTIMRLGTDTSATDFQVQNNSGSSLFTTNANGLVTLSPSNYSGTPSTTGSNFIASANTFTDNATAGSGTATNAVFNSLAAPTLAATNSSVTTTNAATLRIAGPPIAGTNQTITNSWALQVNGDVEIESGKIQVPQANPASTVSIGFSGGGDSSGIFMNGIGQIGIVSNGTEVFRTHPSTGIQAASGSLSAPIYSFSGDTDTGMYRVGADQIGFSAGNDLCLTIQTGGLTYTNSYAFISGTGAQTVSNNTLTDLTSSYWNGTFTVQGDTTATDPSFSGGIITVNKAGRYIVTYLANFSSNSIGRRWSFISLNNVSSASAFYGFYINDAVSTDMTSLSGTHIFDLSSSDNLRIKVFQASGGNLNMESVVSGWFIVYRLE